MTTTARGRGRPPREDYRRNLNEFLKLKPGMSFFVQDANRCDLDPLARMAKASGAGIRIVRVEHDEIYGVAGVRCWRLHGPYDEEL